MDNANDTIKGSDILKLQNQGKTPPIIQENNQGTILHENRSESAGVKNPPCPVTAGQ